MFVKLQIIIIIIIISAFLWFYIEKKLKSKQYTDSRQRVNKESERKVL